jgi:methylated-DNA-[protein]-cysteine S-methyltransferase
MPKAISINSAKVYELLCKIPEGKVTTYGEIAKKLKTKAFRGIGQIVGANPNAPKVPCHRVVRSDGGISGYAFGVDKKIALLKKEGVLVKNDKIVDFKEKLYKF